MEDVCLNVYEWFYRRFRPSVTFIRAIFGIHSDFVPIGTPIANPHGSMYVIPMANVCYGESRLGRLVTFDVRDATGKFEHHVQSKIPVTTYWTIAWYDNNTVMLKSNVGPEEAYLVGTSSIVLRLSHPFTIALKEAFERLQVPRTIPRPSLTRTNSNRTKRSTEAPAGGF